MTWVQPERSSCCLYFALIAWAGVCAIRTATTAMPSFFFMCLSLIHWVD
ncbi:MAG: (2Fe-2S)-binding protein [Candidatus Methylumidiphilus sp.]